MTSAVLAHGVTHKAILYIYQRVSIKLKLTAKKMTNYGILIWSENSTITEGPPICR
jgi:hypothetical protein